MKLVSSAGDLRRGVPSRPLRLAAAAGLAVVALGGLSACAEGNPKHRTDYTTPEAGHNQSQTGAPPEATVVTSPAPTAAPTTAEPTGTGSPTPTTTPTSAPTP